MRRQKDQIEEEEVSYYVVTSETTTIGFNFGIIYYYLGKPESLLVMPLAANF